MTERFFLSLERYIPYMFFYCFFERAVNNSGRCALR